MCSEILTNLVLRRCLRLERELTSRLSAADANGKFRRTNAALTEFIELLFNYSVLKRMECDYRYPARGVECLKHIVKRTFKLFKLAVYLDSQRLKRLSCRVSVTFGFHRHRSLNDINKLKGRFNRLLLPRLDDIPCNRRSKFFLTVGVNDFLQFAL